jgi:SAM-dependent methyltransferase
MTEPERMIPSNASGEDEAPEPLVSVIVIFLDEERFLEEAVESVLAQTYPHWELLLCDDGSTDRSSEIARRYALEHPDRIRYLEHSGHENRGMSATRNLGLAHARGSMVAFLDGDDVWVPEKLTRQVAILGDHPRAAAVYGRLHVWHAWTRRDEDLARDYVQPLGVEPDGLVEPPELLITFLGDDVHTPSGLLFRRSVLDQVGGYEERFEGMHEDGVVLAKICSTWPLYASGEVWYKYRQHPGSCCTREIAAGRDREALLRYLEWVQEYLLESGFEGTPVCRVVEEQIAAALGNDPERFPARVQRRFQGAVRGLLGILATVLPYRVRQWVGLVTLGSRRPPPAGWLHMGNLRRTAPVSQHFGLDRGLPVDRHYIERFLEDHRDDMRGRVLEVADAEYTRRFGGERVAVSDVLHARPGNPEATLVGDLCTGEGIPASAFDCIILTQVLPFLWDVPAAIETARRALAPGGVLLVTVPGISQISRYDADHWGDYWRFTSQSVRRLFGAAFPPSGLAIRTFGNALSATAFLQGMAAEELSDRELAAVHPDYEVVICVRAVRPAEGSPAPAPT